MRSRQRQKGVSVMQVLIIAAILGMGFVLGMRLFPVYMEYYNVRGIMSEVAHSPGIGSKSYLQVWDAINTRFDINDINNINENDLFMNTSDGVTTLTMRWTVLKHLVGNIDGLIKFKYSVKYKNTSNSG